MTWNTAAYPAGWTSVSSAKASNLFLDTDTLTFSLTSSTTVAAVAYEVRDYYGTSVRTGTVSGTTLTLAALPLGWYCLYLYQSGTDATYGSLIGKAMFSILRTDARLLAPPAWGTTPSANIGFVGDDHIVRGLSVLGAYRNSITNAASPSAEITGVQSDRTYQQTYYEANADSSRPRPTFLQFPNGTATSGQQTGVSTAVAALYPDITYFEGPSNEPGVGNSQTATDMQTFKASVKAGNASAKVMGPGPVSINSTEIGNFTQFIANGGAVGLDALSFHFYNCANGDITLGRKVLDRFKKLLAANGLGSVELWQTEWGQFAATYGVFTPRRQARWVMLHRFLLDQYSIPKERDFYCYDTSHGYWDFPAMWKFIEAGVTPMVALMRVYSQELFGKTWTASLDFGTVENDFYIGSKYTAADGSSVLAIMSDGRTDGTVTLRTNASSTLTVVSPFGTISTTPVSGGLATVTVGMEPTYVRLPIGITATVEQVTYGTNLARTATVTGTGTVDTSTVNNGLLENSYDGSGGTEYRDDANLPATVTETFTAAQQIDTVVISCPSPWQQQGTFLDFDVEYQAPDLTWHLLQTITEPTVTFSSPTNQSQIGCFYDSYHSGRSVFVATASQPVTARAVRITVRDATAGGEMTVATSTPLGQGDTVKRIRLQEIGVYCRAPIARHRSIGARL